MKPSPQPNKNRVFQNSIMFTLAIIFIIFPFFILKPISSSILYFFLISISIGSSIYFWVSFVPFFPTNSSGIFNTIQTLLLSVFKSGKSVYHIQAGKFDRDYFVIREKPNLGALLVDENSIVVVINNAGKKRVFSSGYHFIKSGEQVLHTFDLGAHHFFWGPQDTENPFRDHIPDLDLNQIHLNSLRVAQTKWLTKDEIAVVPSFSIFYNFSSLAGKKQLKEMSLYISDYFSEKKITGELQIEINKLFGECVTNIWKVFLEKSNAKQIISSTYQNSPIMDEFLMNINTIINTKTTKDTSDSYKFMESNQLERVKPLEHWKTLNIRVFLKNLWIKQEVS